MVSPVKDTPYPANTSRAVASARISSRRNQLTPEKRTERELRNLGTSLRDVPSGGRELRTLQKYLRKPDTSNPTTPERQHKKVGNTLNRGLGP